MLKKDPNASLHDQMEEENQIHWFFKAERKWPLDKVMAQHLSTMIHPSTEKSDKVRRNKVYWNDSWVWKAWGMQDLAQNIRVSEESWLEQFVFPCTNRLFFSLGKTVHNKELSKYNQKRLLTPWQKHCTLVPRSAKFYFSYMDSEFDTVMTLDPWALWPRARRPNLAQNSDSTATTWKYFCPPYSLLEPHAKLNKEHGPLF